MLPFCGYNMSDYFQHWLNTGAKAQAAGHKLPAMYCVNWFRKGEDGSFVWPGYGDNMRVLKWIVDRAYGSVGAQETLFGWVPKQGHIDLSGLDIDPAKVDEATHINDAEWKDELISQKQFFDQFGERMPKTLELIRQTLLSRLT
jgi:phosphoenolpyruvate carboxykinase (GTP)